MAKAFASRIIRAPIEAVWEVVRDFNGLPRWNPAIVESHIEDGLPPDLVGCIRSVTLDSGAVGRERLLVLDDNQYRVSYNFETPPLPVFNYVGTLELKALTEVDHTLAIWRSTFDEAPEDAGRFGPILSEQVFASGLASLDAQLAGARTPENTVRWQGHAPANVYSIVELKLPLEKAWASVRTLASSSDWLTSDSGASATGARQRRVGDVSRISLEGEPLQEQLIAFSDLDHSLGFVLRYDTAPGVYRANIELFSISSSETTLAVCTVHWRCPKDDEAERGVKKHHDLVLRALNRIGQQ
ncbi:SRPBCC family protein [Pseudomonas sp. GM48]|uniref:SRPBCC family protein n=1 Tax=Pseudomonas sp. GM48 TaxID=1144330 RepID=UPI0002701FF8|nr:SRPBCC family protein [Pseudomonas sp. GM48]EJM62074.1 Polyketide cyclase / dehydrase and lipid transport [Pseudomonas sp. GM48]